jgi:predicted amidophosphoribosyltransferase
MKNPKLTNCKACGRELSPLSPFCRQCGHPQGSSLALWLLVLFAVVLLAAYLAFCLYGFTLCR